MSKKKQNKQLFIEILWGLPSSGKTTYAQESNANQYRTSVVDCDAIFFKTNHKNDFMSKVASAVKNQNDMSRIILDGLFTTNDAVKRLMNRILKEELVGDIIFLVTWWKEDREVCLHNDKGRREQSCEASIKNMPFEIPNAELLGVDPGNIVMRKIVQKSSIDSYIEKIHEASGYAEFQYLDRNFLESSKWSLGGSYSNCFDDTTSLRSADPQPASFKEFDDMMLEICPTIGFLQYKKLYNETVSVETCSSSDYYCNGSDAYFKCDLHKLRALLLELGLET